MNGYFIVEFMIYFLIYLSFLLIPQWNIIVAYGKSGCVDDNFLIVYIFYYDKLVSKL